MRRRLRHLLLFAALLAAETAASPVARHLDPAVVLERYGEHLLAVDTPKTLVFTYTVSQAGPADIEQTHRIYRSGSLVRDEMLADEGRALGARKSIRIARYRNRYAVESLAPRQSQYAFVYEKSERSANHLQYLYRVIPLGSVTAFSVDRVAIDGRDFLPAIIWFHSSNASVTGAGTLTFARIGKYWVPTSVAVQAEIRGKRARERIAFSAYQFPSVLPLSTFQLAKPLPTPALPSF